MQMSAAKNVTPSLEVTRPIRVLHLRDSPWVDGPGRTILESASHVDPNRVEYHIGAFVSDRLQGAHPLVEAARARGLLVHAIADRGGMGTELVDRIIELVDRFDIQVLHTHEFRSDLLGLLCRRRRPLLLMTTAHGWIANDLRGRLFRAANKVLLRSFDKVILVSKAMRQVLPNWWVSNERAHVLHNALVLESYATALERRARTNMANDKVTLLNVGRLSPEKGQALLLNVFARLLQRYPNLHLQFAGIGPLHGELTALAASLGVAAKVEFLGYVPDMGPVYSQCDLVVQSSFTEGLPNVVLEAAYLKVPIVATDVGGTSEVIEHGQSGWLVVPRSFAALEAGIEQYLSHPDRFSLMCDRAHERIKTYFSFHARTESLTQIYEALIAQQHDA